MVGVAAGSRPILGLVLVALACGACSPSRTLEAARLGLDAADGTGNGAAAASVGLRRPVILAGHAGDLYRAAPPLRAGLLLIPGVTPQGRDDPRLVVFAAALARHGFLVFVPELAGLRAQRVGRDDPVAITAAADALATCYGPGVGPRFGLVAISYTVAPAILAALDPVGGQRIGLVLGIGGYHSAAAAITYLTTGYYRSTPQSPWRAGSPEPIAKWVFVLASAQHMPEPRDRTLLTAIAQTRLRDPAADLSSLEAGLGEGGRAMMALATNRDPERAPALIAALPDDVRADLEFLDLSRCDLRALRAQLLLVHGRDDPLLPPTESAALAAAASPGQADLYVVGNLSHVEIRPGGISDTLLLWQAAYRLLERRDGLTPPDLARCDLLPESGNDHESIALSGIVIDGTPSEASVLSPANDHGSK